MPRTDVRGTLPPHTALLFRGQAQGDTLQAATKDRMTSVDLAAIRV